MWWPVAYLGAVKEWDKHRLPHGRGSVTLSKREALTWNPGIEW
jgi:hypothetical protein